MLTFGFRLGVSEILILDQCTASVGASHWEADPVLSHLSPSQHSTSSVSVKEKRSGYLETELKESENNILNGCSTVV